LLGHWGTSPNSCGIFGGGLEEKDEDVLSLKRALEEKEEEFSELGGSSGGERFPAP